MHHGVTVKPRQLASADLRSRLSRELPEKLGSGQLIGVCIVGPIASDEAFITALAPSCRAPSTPFNQVAGAIAKLRLRTPATSTQTIWPSALPLALRCAYAATAPKARADGRSQPTNCALVAPIAADVASVNGLTSVKEKSHQPTEMAPRVMATMYIITRCAYPLNTVLRGSVMLFEKSSPYTIGLYCSKIVRVSPWVRSGVGRRSAKPVGLVGCGWPLAARAV